MLHNQLARLKAIDRLFLLTVAVPTLLSTLYFGFIAADVFISESRFLVRGPERQTVSPLAMLLKDTAFSSSHEDAYALRDFMLSWIALKSLDDRLGMRRIFASKDIDVISRFAGLDWDDSFEALLVYYRKKVDIQIDSASSITTVRVRSFAPEHAYSINKQLLEMGEATVNQLNELGRQDKIRFATAEVRNAENEAKAAELALSAYRDQKSVIDPERQSVIHLEKIAKLQEELFAARSQLSQLRTFTRENPQIPVLQDRIESLRKEIAEETGRVAGGSASLAKKAAEYQSLALDRDFADKQLGVALASLEQARNEAQRKQLYLERIVEPSKPDEAMEPRRVYSILSTFVMGLVVWGVLSMLLAGVREHHD